MTSSDGINWTTFGTMDVDGRAAYSMAVTTQFVRWRVDTDGNPKSQIALL